MEQPTADEIVAALASQLEQSVGEHPEVSSGQLEYNFEAKLAGVRDLIAAAQDSGNWWHSFSCPRNEGHGGRCTCGLVAFRAALAALAEGVKGGDVK